MAFQVVEDALRDILLPDLFQGGMNKIPRREITGLPVKQAGIALPDTTRTAGGNWTASCVITGHLVAAICMTAEFRLSGHSILMGEGS